MGDIFTTDTTNPFGHTLTYVNDAQPIILSGPLGQIYGSSFTNLGTISIQWSTAGDYRAIRAADQYWGNATFHNGLSGKIVISSTADNTALRGLSGSVDIPVFLNDGLFQVTSTGLNSLVSGVELWGPGYPGPVTFSNTGEFNISSTGGARGVNAQYAMTLDNSGIIDIHGGNGDYYGNMGDSVGISVGLGHRNGTIINNSGTISVVDESKQINSSAILFYYSGDINNSGEIDGDYAIRDTASMYSGSNQSIHNSGTMVGIVDLGWGDDQFFNSGKILGLVFLGGGNDLYDGSGGNPVSVDGGDGDDTIIIGDATGGILNGGAGVDTISFAGANVAVTVDLTAQGAQQVGTGLVSLANFENLIGSDFADQLTGDGGANVITGGMGDDQLDGGAGDDTAAYTGHRSNFNVYAQMVNGVIRITVLDMTGSEGTDYAINFEKLRFAGDTFGYAGVQQNHLKNIDGGLYEDVLFQNAVTGDIIYQKMNGVPVPDGFQSFLVGVPSNFKAVGSQGVIIENINNGSLYEHVGRLAIEFKT